MKRSRSTERPEADVTCRGRSDHRRRDQRPTDGPRGDSSDPPRRRQETARFQGSLFQPLNPPLGQPDNPLRLVGYGVIVSDHDDSQLRRRRSNGSERP